MGVANEQSDASWVTIVSIDIKIVGKTDPSWVRSQLLFHENSKFSLAEWKALAERQKELLLDAMIFEDVKIFILPAAGVDSYRCVLEIADGFSYSFNFWPWDATVQGRNLFGGDECLSATLGLDTQAVGWEAPGKGEHPLGYEIGLGHAFIEHEPGWLEDAFLAEGKLFASLGPVARLGVESSARTWSLPNSSWLAPGLDASQVQGNLAARGLGAPGSALRAGAFARLWPEYHFMKPFGMSASADGGWTWSAAGEDLGPYLDASLLVFTRPLDALVISLSGEAHAYLGDGPAILYPATDRFRSPELLEPNHWFTRLAFQITGLDLITFPLGFTALTLTPLAYIEAAAADDGPGALALADARFAAGGGIALGFTNPVGLYFVFGLKDSLDADIPPGFLFMVDISTSINPPPFMEVPTIF